MINLSHFNENDEANMADNNKKKSNLRIAKACGYINMSPDAIQTIVNSVQKNDVLSIARIAAIQGTKQASLLLPLHHFQPLAHVRVDFAIDLDVSRIKATVTVATKSKNGAEVEALTGVNIALISIFDMVKAIDNNIVMTQIHLVKEDNEKEGLEYDNTYGNLDF